ncbi:MAG: phytanoyl-CoA dioxygenase family protein [Pseudomonadota bacterium]
MAMRPVPTASIDPLAESYAENGYLIVDDVLSAAALDELKRDLIKLARGAYPAKSLHPLPADISDQDALRRILCIHMPHFVSPVVRRYTSHPRLTEMLGRVVGAHLAPGYWNGGVKCMQSMFFAKPPNKPGQAWHQDEVFIPTRDRSLCGAWIAVDDATTENGCLWVLPGSHRLGVLYPTREHSQPDAFDMSPESYGFDDSSEVPVEVPAGSAVLFNGYLLHRSKRNVSSRYRRALVNHYMSTQSPLHWCLDEAIEGGGKHGSDNRNVHVVCGDDPYADLGYTLPADAVWLREYADYDNGST